MSDELSPEVFDAVCRQADQAARAQERLAQANTEAKNELLLAIADEKHILYGSDYPYVPAPVLLKKKTALDMALAERGQLEQVYMTNPECLL